VERETETGRPRYPRETERGLSRTDKMVGVEGLTVLLHTAANEDVDFLQVFVDLPV